jgi:hypothetical protein
MSIKCNRGKGFLAVPCDATIGGLLGEVPFIQCLPRFYKQQLAAI